MVRVKKKGCAPIALHINLGRRFGPVERDGGLPVEGTTQRLFHASKDYGGGFRFTEEKQRAYG